MPELILHWYRVFVHALQIPCRYRSSKQGTACRWRHAWNKQRDFCIMHMHDSGLEVFLYDGNIRYFSGRHIPLFTATMACLIFLFFPYTCNAANFYPVPPGQVRIELSHQQSLCQALPGCIPRTLHKQTPLLVQDWNDACAHACFALFCFSSLLSTLLEIPVSTFCLLPQLLLQY